jgi:hypothetical protein
MARVLIGVAVLVTLAVGCASERKSDTDAATQPARVSLRTPGGTVVSMAVDRDSGSDTCVRRSLTVPDWNGRRPTPGTRASWAELRDVFCFEASDRRQAVLYRRAVTNELVLVDFPRGRCRPWIAPRRLLISTRCSAGAPGVRVAVLRAARRVALDDGAHRATLTLKRPCRQRLCTSYPSLQP